MPKGALPVYLASVVGRLPDGALGLLLILYTRELTGSYASGGLVAASFSVALGVAAPVFGRVIDRRGQRGTLLLTGALSAALLVVLALLPSDTPTATACGLAALLGAVHPPMNSCIRTLWSELRDPALRHRMFNLDSVVFEVVYISGPLVIVGLIGGAVSLQAALLASAVLIGGGSVLFAGTALSREWRPQEHDRSDPLGALRAPGVRVLMGMFALFGLSIGAIEIALAAFSEREGSEHAVALLLALWGAGSMAGGIAATRAPAPEDPIRRLALLLVALALLELPLALAGSMEVMAVAITLAGVCLAPCLAQTFGLVAGVAPAGTVTEALTWVTSALAAGIAAGSALSGWLIEASGTTLALSLVTFYGLAAAGIVAASRRSLATA